MFGVRTLRPSCPPDSRKHILRVTGAFPISGGRDSLSPEMENLEPRMLYILLGHSTKLTTLAQVPGEFFTN